MSDGKNFDWFERSHSTERHSSCIYLAKEDIGFQKKDVLIENNINQFYFVLGKFHEKSNEFSVKITKTALGKNCF